MSKSTVNKSAITGRFVKNSTVKSNPKTTYKQTITKKKVSELFIYQIAETCQKINMWCRTTGAGRYGVPGIPV